MIPGLILAEGLIAFCALAFEMTVARLVAPYAGMSTDTWTAIIAGFLLSWAVGNTIGGHLARSAPDRLIVLGGAAVALAALAAALTPWTVPALDTLIVAPAPAERWRLALLAAAPTIGPGLLFGIAPPLLMIAIIERGRGRGGQGEGGFVGLANAAGAMGSAAGAIATIWIGLDLLGTRGTCLAIAGLAAVTAACLMLADRHRSRLRAI